MKAFRLLLFSAALIGAAYAVTYTWLTSEDAEKAGQAVSASSEVQMSAARTSPVAKYPFSRAAIDERKATLDRRLAEKGRVTLTGAAEEPLFKAALTNARATFRVAEHPFVNPGNMAVASLALLALALILPRTRFRVTALMLLLVFGAVALVEFIPEASRISFFDTVSFLTPVHTHFPHVALGFLAVSLLVFMCVSPRTRGYED